ncbi:HD domain-containing protein [Lactobacillus kunkeei]|uniref:HD domain-containing protein n=1 Tax=Apilactobacillus nanyangensis TaxID=2799579 RepID=UPI00164F7A4D|nr:HD domain-containing protein [Apilactobacillus nanyangensis]MBC6388569.1 HD domain-containing protein [Apilactobacillus kunkeei]
MVEKINQLKQYVSEQLSTDTTGHDYTHIQRVADLAKTISKKTEQSDLLIVLSASYLHDVIDDKLVDDTYGKQKEVQSKLKELDYTSEQIDEVMDIITHMSYSANLKHHYELTINGQIVQDADRLDAIGAIGVARAMYFGGHFGDTIYDPAQMPRNDMDKSQYREHTTVINHFYEKLFKLPDLMNTSVAKQMADRRSQYMHDFVREFKDEWQGIH